MAAIAARCPRATADAISRRLAFTLTGLGTGPRRRWRARWQADLLRSLEARTLQDIGIAPVANSLPSRANAPNHAGGGVIKLLEDCAPLPWTPSLRQPAPPICVAFFTKTSAWRIEA